MTWATWMHRLIVMTLQAAVENHASHGGKAGVLYQEKPASRQAELTVLGLEVLLNHLPERHRMVWDQEKTVMEMEVVHFRCNGFME